jgi:ribosomal protein L28
MKSCPICKKGSIITGGYSNRVRATKYNPTGKNRKQPNLQWAKLTDGSRIKICTKCLKKGKQLEIKVIN